MTPKRGRRQSTVKGRNETTQGKKEWNKNLMAQMQLGMLKSKS